MKISRLLLLLLFVSPRSYCQTSIVAVRSDEDVAISADSRQVNRHGDTLAPVKVCKITLLGRRSAFSSAGLAQHPGLKFFAADLAAEAWKNAPTLKTRDRAFTEAVVPKLTYVLQLMRDNAPQDFEEFTTAALETIFVTFENNTPKMIRTNFIPQVNEKGKVHLVVQKEYCPGSCARGNNLFSVNYLGETEAISKALKANQHFSSPAEAAQAFVQIEVDHKKDTVAPPISTLLISSKERRWIAPGMCGGIPQEKSSVLK